MEFQFPSFFLFFLKNLRKKKEKKKKTFHSHRESRFSHITSISSSIPINFFLFHIYKYSIPRIIKNAPNPLPPSTYFTIHLSTIPQPADPILLFPFPLFSTALFIHETFELSNPPRNWRCKGGRERMTGGRISCGMGMGMRMRMGMGMGMRGLLGLDVPSNFFSFSFFSPLLPLRLFSPPPGNPFALDEAP